MTCLKKKYQKMRMMINLGYDAEVLHAYQIKVPVCTTLPKKTSHILVAGKSGSGKSLSARWYLYQMLYNRESRVYIADYKAGEEYEAFEGSPSYASGEEAFQMVRDFYGLFQEVRKNRLRLRTHYTLFVEEWFGLLTYAENRDKKWKAELMSMVGEILAVGRGLNFGVMMCVQRADASLFNTGMREQFQAVVCFGRCSQEQFRMLGFSGELEENPTGRYKAGQALALIDGQDAVREIIVPWIRNEAVMCRQIRKMLDNQPDLTSLIRAVAEGESPGQ